MNKPHSFDMSRRFGMLKKILHLALSSSAAFALMASVKPISASIVSGVVTGGSAFVAGGKFVKLTVPLSNPYGPRNTVGLDNFNTPNLYGFDESQNITLTKPLKTDRGRLNLRAGERLASHYVFFDPGPIQSVVGTVNFDSEVLAIITSRGNLIASDYLVGTGVNYLSPSARGLETGENVIISGSRQISWKTSASSPGDYVRVITRVPQAQTTLINVPGDANPWLAGMPSGVISDIYDSSPLQSPALYRLQSTRVLLQFDTTGQVAYNGQASGYSGPEGLNIVHHRAKAELGKSDVYAPINSLVGVFLDDNFPSGVVPPTLDFSSAISRDYFSFAPALRQTFFIGNGETGANIFQNIIPPLGATRLFLGVMDSYQWKSNIGYFAVHITVTPR